jgi:hypothetical protein
MVRTEVKISMKKKYSACLYFKLLKSYPENCENRNDPDLVLDVFFYVCLGKSMDRTFLSVGSPFIEEGGPFNLIFF